MVKWNILAAILLSKLSTQRTKFIYLRRIANIIVFICLINSSVRAQYNNSEDWQTHFERSNYLESPAYNETMDYFERLAAYSDFAEIISIGKSPQGRDIKCIIVSNTKEFTPDEARASGKPIILILNGIHSGEINGKDASMLLLREMIITKEKEELLEKVILLVVPIFSVDAHERRSEYNRINQIGPKEIGWRTTAQNLNLNRDFMKADTPEMKALLKLYSSWLPDLFIDVHSTDGADHQYHTTITMEKNENTTSLIADWVENVFTPHVMKRVTEKGFLISPFVGFIEGDAKKGIRDWVATPRFSNGYSAIQSRPGLLIESHILKTYEERVFSSKAVLESVLELINDDPEKLLNINKHSDREAVKKYFNDNQPFPLSFKLSEEHGTYLFKGIEFEMKESKTAGDSVKIFTGKKFEVEAPYFNKAIVEKSVVLPTAYIIPLEWSKFVDLMNLHGIEVEQLKEDKDFVVEKYKFYNVTFPSVPYESHFIPSFEFNKSIDTVYISAGSYYVSTNQRTIGVIAHLLEPGGGDSFIKWGMMNQIFERKEYFEDYAMLPIAEKMYENNESIKAEFIKRLEEDEEFKNSSRERLNFFYERSPYYDDHHNLYPILRVIEELK